MFGQFVTKSLHSARATTTRFGPPLSRAFELGRSSGPLIWAVTVLFSLVSISPSSQNSGFHCGAAIEALALRCLPLAADASAAAA